ncbi:MAG: hypothetical protein ACOX7P_01685 [Oscillospiraceae bacterium]|jgi:hypothetical protein
MEKKRGGLKRLIRDNKGTGIITVLVSVAFISVLGTLLLYMSYIGYTMKVTERKSKENFYDAEAAINEIRVGIQKAVSDSIAVANTLALERYNDPSASVEVDFKVYFKDAIWSWDGNALAETLFIGSPDPDVSNARYNCAVLRSFVAPAAGSLTVNNNADEGDVAFLQNGEGTVTALILKNVSVNYVENGFETNVTTDIAINIPDFRYTPSVLVTTAIQEYVIIANESLTQNSGGSITLNGNVFAGAVDITGANSMAVGCDPLTGDDDPSASYIFITGGKLDPATGSDAADSGLLSLGMHSSFKAGSGVSFWAKRLSVGQNADLYLNGPSFVADDLVLQGDGAMATLSGKYFGFGSSTTDASRSSSIIANGHDTRLILTDSLETLLLAGQCFIGSGNFGIGGNVLTGESIAPKSAQIAYLVPPECLNTSVYEELATNPAIFYTSSTPSRSALMACVDTSKDFWGANSSMDDYNAAVQLVYLPLGSQTLVYFYMEFASPDDASAYFSDYFQHNSDNVEKYLKLYCDTLSIPEAADRFTSGNSLYLEDGSAALLPPTHSDFSTIVSYYDNQYSCLSVTLSPVVSDTGTVYSHVVDEAAIEAELPANAQTPFYGPDGTTVVGVISREASTSVSAIRSNYSGGDVKVIVTTGDITVDRYFEGLIIAGGTIYIQNSLRLDDYAVSTALLGKSEDGDRTMLDYLKIGTGSSGSSSLESVTWGLEKLVSYQNWRKH